MATDGTLGLTKWQAVLIATGLVYLAVPNLLYIARAGCALNSLSSGAKLQTAGAAKWVSCFLIVCLGITVIFLMRGIVGIWPARGDYTSLRQALFSNLRDAAWPVVPPNGREMTYYLADIPPGLHRAHAARRMALHHRWVKEGRMSWKSLACETPLPLVMAPLLFVYFTRAEGIAHVGLSVMAFGWWEQLLFATKILAAAALLDAS